MSIFCAQGKMGVQYQTILHPVYKGSVIVSKRKEIF